MNNRSLLLQSKKKAKIDAIWNQGFGVPKHQCFHGCSHDEAHIREACMILMLQKIKGNQLTNIQPGIMKGSTVQWSEEIKFSFGYSLFEKAFAVLKIEGIRYVTENNI